MLDSLKPNFDFKIYIDLKQLVKLPKLVANSKLAYGDRENRSLSCKIINFLANSLQPNKHLGV